MIYRHGAVIISQPARVRLEGTRLKEEFQQPKYSFRPNRPWPCGGMGVFPHLTTEGNREGQVGRISTSSVFT